jgi:DNA-binding CsgD family transcriptional regulator
MSLEENYRLWDSLSPREKEILVLLTEDIPNQEIAKRCFVEVCTVKTQLQRLYKKLGVHTRVGAAVWAVRAGLA